MQTVSRRLVLASRLPPRRGFTTPSSSSSSAAPPPSSRPYSFRRDFLAPLALGTLLTASVGVGLACAWEYNEENEGSIRLGQRTVEVLKMLPTRAGSRLWGRLHRVELPRQLRRPVYLAWTRVFDCNLDEMAAEELESFPHLEAFFTRTLRDGVRPVDADALLVSPADGTVLSHGEIKGNQLLQVKGLTYPARGFFGRAYDTVEHAADDAGSKLMQITIYLAPGDYHYFHSPAQWYPKGILHKGGALLPVMVPLVRAVNGIFLANERVVMHGTWKHGPFLYAAVGAYNVGSMTIDAAPELRTNVDAAGGNADYAQDIDVAVMEKGDRVGCFHLGSTVILVFRAPKDFEFNVHPGQQLRYGEAISK